MTDSNTDNQEAKKYVHENQEDEELAVLRTGEDSSGKSEVEELLSRMVSEKLNAGEQDSEGKDLGYWNKDTFEVFAEKTPETCPDCNRTSNFKLYRKKPKGAIQVTDLFILKHSCGWEKDITPWRLA